MMGTAITAMQHQWQRKNGGEQRHMSHICSRASEPARHLLRNCDRGRMYLIWSFVFHTIQKKGGKTARRAKIHLQCKAMPDCTACEAAGKVRPSPSYVTKGNLRKKVYL
jgi:hypothetical protein